MSAFTAGPWETDDHETHWSVLAAAGQHIADVRQYTDGINPLPEGKANAALIAACPDLADALALSLRRMEAVEKLIVCQRIGRQPSEALFRELDATADAEEVARAALAKADL